MYTQCPECRTIFEIDEEALQASLGIVHCGKCAKRFDALRSLSDSLPADPDATLGDSDAEPRVLTLTTEVTSSGQGPAARRKRRREKAPLPAPEAAPPARPTSAESPSTDPVPATGSDAAPDNPDTDLSAALIADAGIPPDATDLTGDWLATHAEPVQARFTELDIIPLSADELAAIESERRGPPVPRNTAPDYGNDADHNAIEPAVTGPVPESTAATDAGGNPQLSLAVPVELGDAAPAATDGSLEDTVVAPSDGQPADDTLDDALSEPHGPVHVYVRPRARWYAHAGLWWTFGCLLLALSLAAQLAWNDRAALFRNPQTRPWVAQVCNSLPCHLPLIRDVSKLELVSRDIRPDPATAGALVITATLRNDAAFRQPWPLVVVELSDIDGNPVAMRRFRPAEYMPDPARRAAGILPGATVAVAFEVADPGKRAVNFQFGFE